MLVRPRGHKSIRQLSTDMKMNITIRKTSISKEKWFSNHHFQEIFFLHDGPLRSLWMEWWGPYKWPLYTYRGPNVPPLIPDDGAHPVGAYVCFRQLWSVMESFRTCWSLNDDDFLFGKRNFHFQWWWWWFFCFLSMEFLWIPSYSTSPQQKLEALGRSLPDIFGEFLGAVASRNI